MRTFKVKHARILGSLDAFNVLNSSGISGINTTFGPAWLQPTKVQGTRYFKFSAQLDS